MVNIDEKGVMGLSTKTKLLAILRNGDGKPVSGSKLALDLGVSRVAVWKSVQSLINAGYPVETLDSGYSLAHDAGADFLYPWEFGENESMFRFFDNTGSTMDKMHEIACQGLPSGTVVIAEKQSAGRGRYGRNWTSRQGGLYFTVLERPLQSTPSSITDYCLPVMLFQIAVARVLGKICGKPAWLRWPNDIYIDRRKIAGVIMEISGEGDNINWFSVGVGINVNNAVPSGRAVNCTEITGHQISRREILVCILEELKNVKKLTSTGNAYAQGNRILAAEWNSIADCMGQKAAVVEAGFSGQGKDSIACETEGRQLTNGIFSGIDPSGRCIIRNDDGKGALYFNPGPVSVLFNQ